MRMCVQVNTSAVCVLCTLQNAETTPQRGRRGAQPRNIHTRADASKHKQTRTRKKRQQKQPHCKRAGKDGLLNTRTPISKRRLLRKDGGDGRCRDQDRSLAHQNIVVRGLLLAAAAVAAAALSVGMNTTGAMDVATHCFAAAAASTLLLLLRDRRRAPTRGKRVHLCCFYSTALPFTARCCVCKKLYFYE
jgi:hypothetical protein